MSVFRFFLSAELLALIVDNAGPTSSEPVYFIFTYGTSGSPILSVALNKLPKLKQNGICVSYWFSLALYITFNYKKCYLFRLSFKKNSYNFHIPARVPPELDDFFSTAVDPPLLDIPLLEDVAVSLFARIISVHRTASCNSINLSLYWFLSINTRAISTLVNRFLWAIGTSSSSSGLLENMHIVKSTQDNSFESKYNFAHWSFTFK